MPSYKAKILNKVINLEYDTNEEEKFLSAIKALNIKLIEKSKIPNYLNGKISDSELLSLAALELQSEINQMNEKNNESITKAEVQNLQNENIKLKNDNFHINEKLNHAISQKYELENNLSEIDKEIKEIIQMINQFYNE